MISVCIVEDLKEVRQTLHSNVDKETDLRCIKSFGDAESAIGGIILMPEKPNVVIMDIGLPEMNGIDCLKQLKPLYPEIKFLMYTVFDHDEKVFEALKSGADGYILKRDQFEKIAQAIREIISGGAPMSRQIAKKVLDSFRIKGEKKIDIKEKLSEREYEVIGLLVKGQPYRLIAEQLDIVEGTVKQHIHRIYRKLQVNNRIEATLLFQKTNRYDPKKR